MQDSEAIIKFALKNDTTKKKNDTTYTFKLVFILLRVILEDIYTHPSKALLKAFWKFLFQSCL